MAERLGMGGGLIGMHKLIDKVGRSERMCWLVG